MKLFYDTEFLEDGERIGLLSIGMVAEDGRELYAIVDDEDLVTAAVEHPWLRDNVIPHLPIRRGGNAFDWDWDDEHPDWYLVKQRQEVADTVREFIQATPDAELWADYCAYDHVALAQLFGRMVDLPAGVPMWTNDLRQEVARRGNPTLPEHAGEEHNALHDALWLKRAYDSLYPV